MMSAEVYTKKATDKSSSHVLQKGQKPTRMQSTETRIEKVTEMSTEKPTCNVHQVYQDLLQSARQGCNDKVDRMVMAVDFEHGVNILYP